MAGYTVLYQGDTPWRAIAVFDLPDGRRTAAYAIPAVIVTPSRRAAPSSSVSTW